jgi:hypothetical protein
MGKKGAVGGLLLSTWRSKSSATLTTDGLDHLVFRHSGLFCCCRPSRCAPTRFNISSFPRLRFDLLEQFPGPTNGPIESWRVTSPPMLGAAIAAATAKRITKMATSHRADTGPISKCITRTLLILLHKWRIGADRPYYV